MTDTRPSSEPHLFEVVPLGEALSLDAEVWVRLEEGAAPASPFRGWQWLQAWWEHAPIIERASASCVVARDGGGRVSGLMPLTGARRGLVQGATWACGDIGCPDHLDVLADGPAAVSALVAGLAEIDWSVLSLHALDAESAHHATLMAEFERRGWAPHTWSTWGCPSLPLAPTWDDWVATQSSSRRQTLRRKLRRLERDHTVHWRRWEADSLAHGWDVLLRLHRLRWGPDAPLLHARLGSMVRRFAELMAHEGRLWLLSLDLDGDPAAAWLGFTAGDTLCFYQGGRDPRFERAGAGSMLMAHAIREGCAAGFSELDLLRGDEPYKKRWATAERPALSLVARRRDLGGLISLASDTLRSAASRQWAAWRSWATVD